MPTHSQKEITIFWFRRDLRLRDNAGLYHALKQNTTVLPIFIYDTEILNKLENKVDKRVAFIHATLSELHSELTKLNSSLLCLHGSVKEVFKKLISEYTIINVYTNHDYEPSAILRDKQVSDLLNALGIVFKSYKDQVIFEKDEILKDDGTPYTIYTPYSRKWKSKLNSFFLKSYPTEKYFQNLIKTKSYPAISLTELGFEVANFKIHSPIVDENKLAHYKETRDFPAKQGTSLLSVHLRFGTVSIRQLAAKAMQLNETWLNELIWREFFMSILYHYPYVEKGCFKKKYNTIQWRNNETEFDAWCNGKTGYPIVDAGMRELNETGFMHNRVRMIVASFLTKHLLIDWRWGEAYFAEKLLDYELSSNNGNWQWAAGCGCDAAPYFRIFNPYEQTKRFDPQLIYITKWIKELNSLEYPTEIVEHKMARERGLATYKLALTES